MQHYETLIIISSKITEEELPFVIDKIFKIIKKNDGEITLDKNLGKKKLAYPIKQSRYGFYVLIEFNLLPEKLRAVEKDLRLMEEVIRHQIVKAKIRTKKEMEEEMKKKLEYKTWVEKKAEEKLKFAPVREISLSSEASFKMKEKESILKPPKKKISLEELDEKLDKILDDDMIK